MQSQITLSLDAMGGRNAPRAVIEGAAQSLVRNPQLKFLIYGNEQQILPLLNEHPLLLSQTTLYHTEDVVADDAKPAVALRAGRNSSMALAIRAVQEGHAHGVISSGNTGAYMAMAKIFLKTIPGISRPAIATYLPNQKGESVMLDLGANVMCDESNLAEFAIMGAIFATNVLGVQKPSIGLLNIGEEELKGSPVLRRTADMLKAYLGSQFYGFIEGDDITKGTVDVVVTDGFTGNVALKTIEGTARLIRSFMQDAFGGSWLGKLGYLFARPTLQILQARMNPSHYNGAIFLGLNGIAIKSHGGADSVGFETAIGVAVDMLSHGFKDQIESEAGRLKAFVTEFLTAPHDHKRDAL